MNVSVDQIIARDPEVLGGIPVFAGTRVPFHNLIDCSSVPYVERGITTESRRHGGDQHRSINPRRHSMAKASPSLLVHPR